MHCWRSNKRQKKVKRYTLVGAEFMWELGIWVFVRQQHANDVSNITTSYEATGLSIAKEFTGTLHAPVSQFVAVRSRMCSAVWAVPGIALMCVLVRWQASSWGTKAAWACRSFGAKPRCASSTPTWRHGRSECCIARRTTDKSSRGLDCTHCSPTQGLTSYTSTTTCFGLGTSTTG